ncbi:hypothetical protein J1G40_09955 [Muriicola sp. Z0-33]|nr:hypothetical protein [Muriicola sp. Z0-33]
MRSYFCLLPIVLLMIFWSSCRKDFEYGFSTGRLEFSKDTVFLDTVFTNIGSSTYTLKVYNRSRDDILIPTIALAQGEASSYRLNVDGIPGKSFEDIPILAQDSIFIFVETTYDIAPTNQNEFLYTDLLQFDSGSNLQQVPIVTLIKDAVFLYPSVLADGSKETLFLGLDEEGNEIRIEGFILQDNQLNFNNEKPYVIYGYAAVAENKILTIEAGTRVHFHKDSGMLIGQGGTLQVNGSLSTNPEIMENEVIFEGDRLETALSEVPGQWGTIWLSQGSLNNVIDHLTVKNATLGMLVEGLSVSAIPTLTIKNSQIHNSATINIWARQSEIQAENVILGNAGNTSLKCSLGGEYSFIHTTIANYWSNGFRSGTALELSNFETDGNNEIQTGDLIAANFTNCIIDGNISRELSLNTMEGATFNFTFKNSMLKFRDLNNQFADNPLYDFTNPDYYNTLILNEDTNFLDTANSDFRIGSSSFAIDIADTDAAALVPLDIFGTDRTETPDIGAIEFLVQ